jgi:hypothetical protein
MKHFLGYDIFGTPSFEQLLADDIGDIPILDMANAFIEEVEEVLLRDGEASVPVCDDTVYAILSGERAITVATRSDIVDAMGEIRTTAIN